MTITKLMLILTAAQRGSTSGRWEFQQLIAVSIAKLGTRDMRPVRLEKQVRLMSCLSTTTTIFPTLNRALGDSTNDGRSSPWFHYHIGSDFHSVRLLLERCFVAELSTVSSSKRDRTLEMASGVSQSQYTSRPSCSSSPLRHNFVVEGVTFTAACCSWLPPLNSCDALC